MALLQGLGSRRITGNLAVNDDTLALDVTTLIVRGGPSSPLPAGSAVVDRGWLTWVPAKDAMGAVSIAFEPGAAFWDRAFALADRIERADPVARRGGTPSHSIQSAGNRGGRAARG